MEFIKIVINSFVAVLLFYVIFYLSKMATEKIVEAIRKHKNNK